jgi:hypothetical protein
MTSTIPFLVVSALCAGCSVAALALGVVLWQFDRPTVQHASSTQWPLDE